MTEMLKIGHRQAFAVLSLLISLVIGGCGGGGGGGGDGGGSGGKITLAWDANTEPDLSGYRVYYGTAPRLYEGTIDVGNTTNYILTGLTTGQTYYIVVTAYDTSNNESKFSDEVSGAAK